MKLFFVVVAMICFLLTGSVAFAETVNKPETADHFLIRVYGWKFDEPPERVERVAERLGWGNETAEEFLVRVYGWKFDEPPERVERIAERLGWALMK